MVSEPRGSDKHPYLTNIRQLRLEFFSGWKNSVQNRQSRSTFSRKMKSSFAFGSLTTRAIRLTFTPTPSSFFP
jgi:hypothetical protein